MKIFLNLTWVGVHFGNMLRILSKNNNLILSNNKNKCMFILIVKK